MRPTRPGSRVERSDNGGSFAPVGTPVARIGTGGVTFVDTSVTLGNTYAYRVAATIATQSSAFSNTATIVVDVPAAPTGFTATNGANQGTGRRVQLNWVDASSNETGFTIERATNATFTTGLSSVNVGANLQSYLQSGLTRNTDYYFRIRANNALGSSAWVGAVPSPIRTTPNPP